MSTWNDVRKHSGDGCSRRPLTPETFKEGAWVCHSLSSRWFKLQIMDGDMVGGFDIRDSDVVVPWNECYHAWDPRRDSVRKNTK